MRQADGRGDAEVLFSSEATATPQDWSPDGKHLAIDHGIGKSDLWIVPLDGGEPFSLVATEFDEGYARFSPDGEWLGYISNESGRYELYLTRFPGGEGKWQLSANGADWLLGWKKDGPQSRARRQGRAETSGRGACRARAKRRRGHASAALSDSSRKHVGRGARR